VETTDPRFCAVFHFSHAKIRAFFSKCYRNVIQKVEFSDIIISWFFGKFADDRRLLRKTRRKCPAARKGRPHMGHFSEIEGHPCSDLGGALRNPPRMP
jgi:hypothetical protein